MKSPINSEKHYRQVSVDATMGGTIKNNTIVVATETPAGNQSECRIGAVIKAVYVEMWVMASAQNIGSQTISLEKRSGDSPLMTFAQAAQLHTYPNKKNILYVTQGLTGENDSNPIPVMRGWFNIPKGKQRFGLGDSLILNLSANVEDLQHCGLYIFKEYF